MNPVLSIIIPVLNEEKSLPILLKDLENCKRHVTFPIECIIVDGGSVDRSEEICRENGVSVVQAPRGRGQQLAAGADVACGDVLLFLHADSRLTAQHCVTAVALAKNGQIVAGGFKLKFDDTHPILRLAEQINEIRFWCTKIFYGDHGIFLRRDKYEAVGGMPPQSLFEDIAFSKRLKRQGKTIMTAPPLVTSARRFREGGVVRTYLKMASLHILHWLGTSPNHLAKLYQNDAPMLEVSENQEFDSAAIKESS